MTIWQQKKENWAAYKIGHTDGMTGLSTGGFINPDERLAYSRGLHAGKLKKEQENVKA